MYAYAPTEHRRGTLRKFLIPTRGGCVRLFIYVVYIQGTVNESPATDEG